MSFVSEVKGTKRTPLAPNANKTQTEPEKQGTPNTTRKKEPQGIDLYTVPIATLNTHSTPVGKGGQSTPRRVQLSRVTSPGVGTGASSQNEDTATPPSATAIVPRRVQLTTLSPTPSQNLQAVSVGGSHHTISAPTSVQAGAPPRRIRLTRVPSKPTANPKPTCGGVETTAPGSKDKISSSVAAPTKAQSGPATASIHSKDPKPRRVSLTTLSSSLDCQNTRTTDLSKSGNSSLKSSQDRSTTKKEPRRVLLTPVTSSQPHPPEPSASNHTGPRLAEPVLAGSTTNTEAQYSKKGNLIKHEGVEVSPGGAVQSAASQKGACEKSNPQENCSQDARPTQGTLGASTGGSTKPSSVECASVDSLNHGANVASHSPAAGPTVAAQSPGDIAADFRRAHLITQRASGRNLPYREPSRERQELLSLVRKAFDAIHSAKEGEDIHQIPAVQNVDNLEKELAHLAQGAVGEAPQVAPHLAQLIAEEMSQAAPHLAQGAVGEAPQAARHLAQGAAEKMPQDAPKESIEKTPQNAPQGAVEKTPQDGSQLAQGAVGVAPQNAPQLVQGVVGMSPQAALNDPSSESSAQVRESSEQLSDTRSSSTTCSSEGSNGTSGSSIRSRDNVSTPSPRPGSKRPYPLEPEVIIINDNE